MSLFTKSTDVAALRADRLAQVAQTYMPDVTVSDDYLWEKLLAAEADIERQLRMFVAPREIVPQGTAWVQVPDDAPQADIDALAAQGKLVFKESDRVLEEPGYDYDPSMFQGNAWGHIQLRHRPIIALHSLHFAYPALDSRMWEVPLSWARPDKKYGVVNLVPVQGAIGMPLNSFVMSVMGGGRTIPLMLQVRYTAGLQDARVQHPDVVDLIKKLAVLLVVEDQYLPQSGSVSADGLSQSLSVDAGKYRETVEKRVETLRQSFQGIRLMVA